MSLVQNRPSPPPEPPAIQPMPRPYYSLLNELHTAGGSAVLDMHANLTIDEGRGMLAGRFQDWMKLVAFGMIEGAGDGRTLRLTEEGRRTIIGHRSNVA